MKLKNTLFASLLTLFVTLALASCVKAQPSFDFVASGADTVSPEATREEEQKQKEPSVSAAIAEDPSEEDPSDAEYKYVAFTFDDGPHDTLTRKFVDKLAEYDGRGTFFVIGDRIDDKTAESLKYAIDNGNEIGIHAFTHKYIFNSCDEDTYSKEIKYTRNTIFSYVGVEPHLMRPPQGAMTAERVQASKYPIILWSVDSRDWVYKDRSSDDIAAENIDIIVENVVSQVKNGDIILMHEIYDNSYQAFSVIIELLYREGYRFVTVSELLGESIQSGIKYHSLVVN